jgi:3-methyladenine DNA glycosylase AlkD
MHLSIQPLSQQLQTVANADKAAGAKAYMKNHFEFLGIGMPERRRICKAWIKETVLKDTTDLENLAKALWQMAEREYQYCAIELLAYHKKLWNENIISLFEYCITHKSWWDTVDFIATECLGPYFQMFPMHTASDTCRWNESDNMWLQRSSLLFQKNYKKNTDTALLSKYINHLSHSKEFFICKAIGWALREYAKTYPQWVAEFVRTHSRSPLSQREALKHIS